ncbi:helix-turn-helix domain-containing protein [Ornithinimicrobium avium]|uniref:Helix-turn-helix domain-containing protein n=1 Tax=Ornithinimicrobium avium TaxID=2283195 RepID=A0A345NLW9_9MICO|nr:helix-turn-helix domain-containing protein [Ornithinimicrobium avium]AXH96027.1 helix-turn-helix domain-containing protein [Ornithinimicrobium avium]
MSKRRIDTTTKRRFESLSEAAERTGLSTYTLRRRIAEGKLPAYRSGRRVIRVEPDDVDKLLTRIPTASWHS